MTRTPMPTTRGGRTHKIVVEDEHGGELDLYVRTGEYEDGRLGEVFVSIGKQGSTLQGMLDGWAMLLSVALQHGITLASLTERFSGTSFPPSGRTSDGEPCTSLYDCVVRYLWQEYGASTTESG